MAYENAICVEIPISYRKFKILCERRQSNGFFDVLLDGSLRLDCNALDSEKELSEEESTEENNYVSLSPYDDEEEDKEEGFVQPPPGKSYDLRKYPNRFSRIMKYLEEAVLSDKFRIVDRGKNRHCADAISEFTSGPKSRYVETTIRDVLKSVVDNSAMYGKLKDYYDHSETGKGNRNYGEDLHFFTGIFIQDLFPEEFDEEGRLLDWDGSIVPPVKEGLEPFDIYFKFKPLGKESIEAISFHRNCDVDQKRSYENKGKYEEIMKHIKK